MSGSQVQNDFRVHVGFFAHRKYHRLLRELGEAGIVALLRLWAYAAVNHPDGALGDVEPADLASMAAWQGDPEALFRSLEGAGFIDAITPPDAASIRTGSGSDPTRRQSGLRFGVRLHDWREHQPYIAGREARQEASKRANKARWERRKSVPRKGSSAPDPNRIRIGGKAESPSSTPTSTRSGGGAEASAGPSGPPPRLAPADAAPLLPMLAPPRPIPNARTKERPA